MAKDNTAASKEAAPKKVIFELEKVKYELLGGPNKNFIFQGERFTKEEAGKNEALCAALVASGSSVVEKV
jgi:hypothetical protein